MATGKYVMSEQSLTITDLSNDARGVGKSDEGKAIFVKGALPNEKITVNVYKKHEQFDEADLVELIEKSEHRVEPKCQYFGYCGGCALQHLDAEKQIDYKANWLADNLERIGKIEPESWLPPLKGPFWGYRYKARLGVKHVHAKGRVLVGFRELKGRYLAEIERCEILHSKVGDNLMTLSDMIGKLSIYNKLPQIEVAASDTQVALNFRVLATPTEEDLALLSAYGEQYGFLIYTQPKGPLTTELLYAPEGFTSLAYEINADCKLSFAPYQFTQVNPSINRAMLAIELLELNSEDRVLDLFCGIGNFTLPIAQQVAAVVGVESDTTAIETAKQNARDNNIENSQFYVGNLFDPEVQSQWARQDYTKVLLDPPRSGAIEILPHVTKVLKPERIVYVSCQPSTLARDIAYLVENGYRLEKAGVMDMFPHTAHVESMALLVRK
jgi:23S rRNA (uracil1939-C5)-methyltransferase